MLPCGHTLCLRCAKATRVCEADGKEFSDAASLVDNYFIIDMISSIADERSFYCLQCKMPATSECVEEHTVRNLRNVQKRELAPKVDALRESAALQQDIVSCLVDMLPCVSDSFNRLVEAATLRQDSHQQVLDLVEELLSAGGTSDDWQRTKKSLDEALRKSEEERPDSQQLLALLQCRVPCHLELELEGRRIEATVDLKEKTSVARALRFVLYNLGTTGNLQSTPIQDEESDLGSDWENAEASDNAEEEGRREVQEPQGAASLEFQRASLQEAPSAFCDRRIKRATRRQQRPAVNRENYELLKTLEEQAAVPSMEPFDCPICMDAYQPGDGIILKGCLHVFCRACLQDTVQHSEAAEVQCPYQDNDYSCENVLSQREIKSLVTQDVFDRHLERSIKVAESSMDNTFHCKTVDCEGWCEFEPGVNQFVCPICYVKNCLQCQVIHDPEDCATYQDRIKRQAETDVEARQTQQQLDTMLQTGNAMRCPKCNVVIMKRSGCDALVCAMCKLNICWATKQARWGPNGVGDTSGGCRCKVNGRSCHPNCGNCH